MSDRGGLFYVYEYWRPDRDVCFYVGKGKGSRAWRFDRKNNYCKNIIKFLAKRGLCTEVRLVNGDLNEQSALSLEAERISFWRSVGVDLTNCTLGGEGTRGFTHSAAARKKIGDANKLRDVSNETRDRMSRSIREVFKSEDLRRRIAVSLKQTLSTPEGRAKRIASRRKRELDRVKDK